MNINNVEDIFGGKEEYEKWLNEMKEALKTYSNLSTNWGPSPVWTHGQWIMEDKEIIPFEQDENGMYGYKTLLQFYDKWPLSPNYRRMPFPCEWIDNQLHAHEPPKTHNDSGIYCTKSLEGLSGWFREYQRELYYSPASLVVVRLQVWGMIVEHTKGFRAEHARIERIINGYR